MNQTLNVVLFAKSEIPQMGLKRIGVLYNEQKMIDNKRKSVLDISIQDCKELAANNILDKEILKRNKMDCKTPEEENYFLSELQKKEEIENAWGNKITVKIDLDKLPDPEEDPWQNLKSGSTRENKTGLFGDTLTEDEVSVSEKAYNLLRREHFKFKKGTEKKLEKIFPLKPNPERTLSEMNEVKSTLFEIRFLAELFRRGAKNIEYEFKTGIGDTDVDFKCSDSQNNTWLIELTSLRESEHIKSKTYQNGDLYGCDYDEIGTEELVIRAQRRLIEKTYNNKTCLPIKFPEVTNANTYNVIAIDMKSYLLSSDDYDYYLICYGNSEKIPSCSKSFIGHIKGIFSDDLGENKYIRERIHFIMFVLEKKYSDCGIEEQNYIYPNPNLLEENGIARNIEKFFPLKTHLIPCPSLQKR